MRKTKKPRTTKTIPAINVIDDLNEAIDEVNAAQVICARVSLALRILRAELNMADVKARRAA
jgi:hypothetical protein